MFSPTPHHSSLACIRVILFFCKWTSWIHIIHSHPFPHKNQIKIYYYDYQLGVSGEEKDECRSGWKSILVIIIGFGVGAADRNQESMLLLFWREEFSSAIHISLWLAGSGSPQHGTVVFKFSFKFELFFLFHFQFHSHFSCIHYIFNAISLNKIFDLKDRFCRWILANRMIFYTHRINVTSSQYYLWFSFVFLFVCAELFLFRLFSIFLCLFSFFLSWIKRLNTLKSSQTEGLKRRSMGKSDRDAAIT